MTKYKVHVVRIYIEGFDYEVEAENDWEAEDIARELSIEEDNDSELDTVDATAIEIE